MLAMSGCVKSYMMFTDDEWSWSDYGSENTQLNSELDLDDMDR